MGGDSRRLTASATMFAPCEVIVEDELGLRNHSMRLDGGKSTCPSTNICCAHASWSPGRRVLERWNAMALAHLVHDHRSFRLKRQ